MLRIALLRYGIPLVLVVTAMTYVAMPFADRLLDQWFRNDVDMRAQMLASAVEPQLAELLRDGDEGALQTYLTRVTSDDRLLAMLLCRADGTLLYETADTPPRVNCRTGADHTSGSFSMQTPSGSIEVSPFAFRTASGRVMRVLMIHDLSFIDRRQSVARNYLLAMAAGLAAVLGLFVAALSWLLVRRWVSLLVKDIRSLRFLDDSASAPGSRPVISELHKVLREIESNQRLEIDFHENWTPQALQQVVREHLRSPEILLISNREPYIHNAGPDGPVVQIPASGMVRALEGIMRSCEGTWIAHGSGSADRQVVDRFDRVRVPPEQPSYVLRRVWLTEQQEEGFYYGFSNAGLWPLCHLAYVRPVFRAADWKHYEQVNRRFAEVVVQESQTGNPLVLIQDYHFALLPQFIRERRANATVVLFWHIPWPNAETFGVCPWKTRILQNLLAADILGFHTRYHCQNFLASVDRFVECQIDHERMTVTLRGHTCLIRPYPISIEWPPRWLAEVPPTFAAREAVRARYGVASHVALGIGVERWDFTKGILERFQALECLFEQDRERRGRFSFLQVAAPSRSKLPAYRALQEQTRREAERINRRFGTASWQPIILVDRHQEPVQVYELYRAADFCMVNSLHDGMNLVAKEFVAARDDLEGVLIISSFAGAARELVEALLVNPFDLEETAAAMRTALDMPREERRKRMKLMRATVKQNNVYRWAGRILMDAARIRQQQELPSARSLDTSPA